MEVTFSDFQKAIRAVELEGKLSCFEQFLEHALNFEDDIASFPLGSEEKYS
jgi:hypothetical protein